MAGSVKKAFGQRGHHALTLVWNQTNQWTKTHCVLPVRVHTCRTGSTLAGFEAFNDVEVESHFLFQLIMILSQLNYYAHIFIRLFIPKKIWT